MGNKCVQCLGKNPHLYDHEKIQRKMDKLEELDPDNEDPLMMPGSTTSYKSINYKHQGPINGSSVAISSYESTEYAEETPH